MKDHKEVLKQRADKAKDIRPAFWRRALVGSAGATALAGFAVGTIAAVGGLIGFGGGAIGYAVEQNDYDMCGVRDVAAEICVWYDEDVDEAAKDRPENEYYTARDFHDDENRRLKGYMARSGLLAAAGGLVIAASSKLKPSVGRSESGQQINTHRAAIADISRPILSPDPSDQYGRALIEYQPSDQEVAEARRN